MGKKKGILLGVGCVVLLVASVPCIGVLGAASGGAIFGGLSMLGSKQAEPPEQVAVDVGQDPEAAPVEELSVMPDEDAGDTAVPEGEDLLEGEGADPAVEDVAPDNAPAAAAAPARRRRAAPAPVEVADEGGDVDDLPDLQEDAGEEDEEDLTGLEMDDFLDEAEDDKRETEKRRGRRRGR